MLSDAITILIISLLTALASEGNNCVVKEYHVLAIQSLLSALFLSWIDQPWI